MVAEIVTPPIVADGGVRARVMSDVSGEVAKLARAMGGGRVSLDSPNQLPGFGSGLYAFVPPPSAEGTWRTLDLDLVSLERLSPAKVAELVTDLSPEASGAVNDWLRFCNPGYDCLAIDPRTDKPHARGQKALDEFQDILVGHYGSVDVVYNVLYMGSYIRGAFLHELVSDGRYPIDLATPDPATVRFRRIRDQKRGDIYELGQMQGGHFVSFAGLDAIKYVPVDRFPGSPYGRPMISSALFLSLFLLGLLRDVRRVVAQQGYPRMDIEINVQRLWESIPEHIQNLEEYGGWLLQVIQQVTTAYQGVRPEDAWVHLDATKLNKPVGTLGAESLGAFDGLVGIIERSAARALKTSPMIMGLDGASSEARANREWEIHAARIKAVQHWAESSLSAQYTRALEMQGIPAVARLKFAELRSAELMRDEQVQKLKLDNARAAYDDGIISQDERAAYAWGKEKADQEEPRVAVGTGSSSDTTIAGEGENPEPGSKRYQRKVYTMAEVAALVQKRIAGADEELPALPASVPVTEDDQGEASDEFDEAIPDFAGLLDAEVVE